MEGSGLLDGSGVRVRPRVSSCLRRSERFWRRWGESCGGGVVDWKRDMVRVSGRCCLREGICWAMNGYLSGPVFRRMMLTKDNQVELLILMAIIFGGGLFPASSGVA